MTSAQLIERYDGLTAREVVPQVPTLVPQQQLNGVAPDVLPLI